MNTQTNFQTSSLFGNVQIGTQERDRDVRNVFFRQTREDDKRQSNGQNFDRPKNLHKKFLRLGRERNRLLNEMMDILPEIYESGIWKKYADSIVEYAGKYGGISGSAVRKRLRLEKHLKNKPVLKEAIKTAGVNKVDLVARLATPETDEAFADKVNNMSKGAVAELAKELRGKWCDGQMETVIVRASFDISNDKKSFLGEDGEIRDEQMGARSRKIGVESQECRAVPTKIKLELDEEMSGLFLRLKEKWGLSNREVMKILLTNAVRTEFPSKKVSVKSMRTQTAKKVKSLTGEKIATGGQAVPTEAAASATSEVAPAGESRYINAYQKRAILEKHNHQCGYNGCNKPAQHLHHIDRWHHHKKHTNIIPLCKIHHEFAHNGLVENEKNNWRLNISGQPRTEADRVYRIFRQQGTAVSSVETRS